MISTTKTFIMDGSGSLVSAPSPSLREITEVAGLGPGARCPLGPLPERTCHSNALRVYLMLLFLQILPSGNAGDTGWIRHHPP